jgi:hypothetical protein
MKNLLIGGNLEDVNHETKEGCDQGITVLSKVWIKGKINNIE